MTTEPGSGATGTEPAPATTVAVDLGGTRVRAALVAADGRVIHRVDDRTPATDDRPDVIGRLVDALLADPAGADVPPSGAVIGIPGIIDHDAEALLHAPNLNPSWQRHLTAEGLSASLGMPVSLANDADLAAVGEASFGAGRHHRDVVYVTVSTGVGAGAVLGGRLVRGRRSGLEIGHTTVDRRALPDDRPATVEELGAGPALAKAAAEAGIGERDAAFMDLVRDGDGQARLLWDDAIGAVAVGVTNVAWLLSPGVVVVGGGVAVNNPDLVVPPLTRHLAAHGPAVDRPIEVAVAELGDDAALAGSARWFTAIGRPAPTADAATAVSAAGSAMVSATGAADGGAEARA